MVTDAPGAQRYPVTKAKRYIIHYICLFLVVMVQLCLVYWAGCGVSVEDARIVNIFVSIPDHHRLTTSRCSSG